ncbi:PREDICTED: E3 ubiquitin-protein ligase TRIM71-like [Amphimedon queenslandica]|uniref:B-box C-terminal domain-containing protein n=1 Tax=Amphimedon queenslandica TaxID=400682 RepID=A0AAN0IPU0_AMPQE|nr:PREDICTED: E3 ubiquitin-protein ligase TRIM71-like [Amphimedon queenslandica]|eukprot:XP_011406384.1 PREDICTED: E3 ubiquitin-protein ligase TRIM71-like [Amphimedon queenslandica]
MSLTLLEDVENDVEQSLQTDSLQQVLMSKRQMMERMSRLNKVTAQINVEELHIKEKADFVLSKGIISLHHIGDIISGTTALQQCRVKEINHFSEAVSFSLSIEAPDSTLLLVPLPSLRCSLVPVSKGDQPIHTIVTTTSTDPGVYRIQCNPSIHGAYTVKVQVYDIQLEDTLLTVPFDPYLDNITPVHTITELTNPWGVAVSDDNQVIITECGVHCQVYVVDNGNHRIQVLNPDLTFSHSFGSRGSANGQFKSPGDIAIDSQGLVYVVDGWNHRIQKFSPDGKFVDQFGSRGSDPGQLNGPFGSITTL